jgi:predicted transcriptional regulator
MESHTIRVSKKTLSAIRGLAEKNEKTMTTIVEEAVRDYEIKKYWEEYYADYEALKANPEAWTDFQEELSAWDCTLADGLKDLPYEQDDSPHGPSPRRSVDRRSKSTPRT